MSANTWQVCSQNLIYGDTETMDLAWRLMDSLADPIVALNSDQKIMYLNKAAEQLLNKTFTRVFGHHWTEAIKLFDDGKLVDNIAQCKSFTSHSLPDKNSWYLMQMGDGNMTPVRLSIANISGHEKDTPSGVSIVIHDVGRLKNIVDNLAHQSTHDVLTGMANRLEIENRINRLLKKSIESDRNHALLFTDLDGFKKINDEYGHLAGDEILCQVAKLFNSFIRDRDTMARYGGDEFVLLLEHCTLTDAFSAARMLRIMLHKYAPTWQGRKIDIDVSIGIAEICSYKKDEFVSIVAKADAACYKAKNSISEKIFFAEPAGNCIKQCSMES